VQTAARAWIGSCLSNVGGACALARAQPGLRSRRKRGHTGAVSLELVTQAVATADKLWLTTLADNACALKHLAEAIAQTSEPCPAAAM
jgi:hypothetical protein